MFRIIFIFFLIFFCSFSVKADTEVTSDYFSYATELKPPADGYKPGAWYMFDFPKEYLFGTSHPSLTAMRLYDKEKKEVPFTVQPRITPAVFPGTVPLKITSFQIKSAGEEETLPAEKFVLTAISNAKPPAGASFTSLGIDTTSKDFAYWVTVRGSADGKNWEKLTEAPVFDFSSRINFRKTSIDLPATRHSFFYLTFSNSNKLSKALKEIGVNISQNDLQTVITYKKNEKEPLRIDKMELFHEGTKSFSHMVYKTIDDVFAENEGDTTLLTFITPIYTEKIMLDIETTAFRRKALWQVGSSQKQVRTWKSFIITRTPEKKERTTLVVNSGYHPYQRLIIENRENPPLRIHKMSSALVQQMIFFVAEEDKGPYSLYFAPKENTLPITTPHYDITAMITDSNWTSIDYTELATGEVQSFTTPYSPPKKELKTQERSKLFLFAAMALVAVFIIIWLVTLLKKSAKKQKE